MSNLNSGIQLNKYIADSGIASRRKAQVLIEEGHITVNDRIIKEPGYRVMLEDTVKFNGQNLSPKEHIYILLNKPKNYITTLSDEKGRKTVLDLIKIRTHSRIFPVGRLDRATTGLLLLTNDGHLSQKLAHPSYKIEKVYLATLDKPINLIDINKITKGIVLFDGFTRADTAKTIDEDRKIVRIALHSGKNLIVRRIFEHLGYKVLKLDRIQYAGLTKKNLEIGKWRFLKKEEINKLLALGSD